MPIYRDRGAPVAYLAMRVFGSMLGCILLAGAPGAAVASSGPELTPAEREYLAGRGPIRVCADPNYAPLDFIDARGHHRGIAADLLSEIGGMLGVSMQLVPSTSWTGTMDLARAGECDVVAMLNETPARAEYLNFTRPYVTFENAIVAHRPEYHHGLASLAGRTIALPDGYRIIELITAEHPDIGIIRVASHEAALRAVSRGEAYATLVNQQRLAGDIQRLRLPNVHYAGDAGLQDQYRMGVRKDDELLAGILDRAIAHVPSERFNAIMERWYVVPVEPSVDWRVVLGVAGASLVILAFLLLHLYHRRQIYRLLEGQNQQLAHLSMTDALTQTGNRRLLDARLDEEIERAHRYQRPFAVILIDLDHFKEINDRHGHQAGDDILVELTALIRAGQRATDLLGRWGGDEFMLLCSETGVEEARVLADRLRQAVEANAFCNGLRLTISAGVAELEPADTRASLLLRADEALYRATAAGRNRVEASRTVELHAPTPARSG